MQKGRLNNSAVLQNWFHARFTSTFKIEIQRGGRINSVVLQNRFPPKKLGPSSLICGNFKKMRKEECWSYKFLTLKYRRGG